MASGEIDFIEADERGKFHKEQFEIGPDETKELAATIIRIAGEIRDLAFWDKRCEEKECPYCALRDALFEAWTT
jgi:succinate dehydrogenase/fumarate reductase-like Fe-S protein